MTLRRCDLTHRRGREDGGYRLDTAEDSDNHESPVEWVGFSESLKGKHPDVEKEIGARRIQREMLSCLRLRAY